MINFCVSIIIPVYNAEQFIIDCLNSIKNQTYKNLQIIIINDGSTDNSLKLIQQFIQNDSRFIVITQENRGCSAAKNKGLELVKGDFVQYLDADDILSNDKIESQVKALSEKSNSIAVCKTIVFKYSIIDTNIEIDTNLIMNGGNNIDFIANLWGRSGVMGMVQPNAYLVPISIIKKIGIWDESLSPSPDEDGEYFARAIFESSNIVFTEGINYYRKIEQVDSLSKAKSLVHAIGLFKTIQKKFEPYLNSHFDIFKNLYALQLSSCAYQFANQYPHIYELVENELIKYNISGYQFLNNIKFSIAARLIGFKKAMCLRKIINGI
jgi:glycosyltransferase involved in cell wall biosynthesis